MGLESEFFGPLFLFCVLSQLQIITSAHPKGFPGSRHEGEKAATGAAEACARKAVSTQHRAGACPGARGARGQEHAEDSPWAQWWAWEGRPGLLETRLLLVPSEPGRAWLSMCAASCGRLGWPPSHHGHTRFRVTESAGWGGSPLSGYGSCACLVAQSCLILCDPTDCSPPGSSVHGISQARILEWVAISFPRGSSPPRN